MLYEMIYGEHPFEPSREQWKDYMNSLNNEQYPLDPSKRSIRRRQEEVRSRHIQMKPFVFDEDIRVSAECKDLITKLLTRDINQRIGGNEIRNYPWFANTIDWENLNKKELVPPFTPEPEGVAFEL